MAFRVRIRQLRVFRAVMNTGSVTMAARILNVTQPAASRLLASLEEDLGFKLFYRTGGRLVPSVEGRSFYRQIAGILAGIDDIETIANDIRLNKTSRLRLVAIGPVMFGRLLSDGMRRFCEEFPGTKFSVDWQERMDIDEWVASRQADLGFTLFPVERQSLETEPITTVAAVAILPKSHALANRDVLTPADFQDEPLILPKRSTRLRQMADAAFLESGKNFEIFSETASAIVSCRLVARGLGVGISDPFSVSGYGGDDLHVTRWRPELKMTYGAIWPKDRKPTKTMRRLIETLGEVAAEIKAEFPAAHPDSLAK